MRSDLGRWSRRPQSQTVDHCEGQAEELDSPWGRQVSLCHLQEAEALSDEMGTPDGFLEHARTWSSNPD